MSHWVNDYIGIPYRTGGRTKDGLDCWGLVRLVHREQFGNDLPSFDGLYDAPDDERVVELIARNREGWARVDTPQPGDVVVFRVWGGNQHVGVVTEPGKFLHVRIGRDAVVERLDGSIWVKRVEGVYRYEGASESVSVAGLAHPLRTVRLDGKVPAGLTLAEIQQWIFIQTCTPAERTRSPAIITVDGFDVPKERWKDFRPLAGQRVEYRAIAEGDVFRDVLKIGVLVGALLLAPILAPYFLFLGLGLATTTALATAAIAGAGALLVNYLFPVRQEGNKGLADEKKQNILEGGSNQPNPYGAIPIVLGKVKYTPPLAAQNYVETTGVSSYLRAVLCWGYGPLQVSEIRIGDIPIQNLNEVSSATLTGESGETNSKFSDIYPRDTTQEVINFQLLAPQLTYDWSRNASGLTTITSTNHGASVGDFWYSEIQSQWYEIASVPTANTFTFQTSTYVAQSGTNRKGLLSKPITRVISGNVSNINVSLHFPNGIRAFKTGGTQKVGEYVDDDFSAVVQVRQLNSSTLAPITSWGDVSSKSNEKTIRLPTAFFNTDNDQQLEEVYQWHFVVVDEFSKISVLSGSLTDNKDANPSGNLLARLQAEQTGFSATFTRFPTVPGNCTELWRVLVKGDSIVTASNVDKRPDASFTITGAGLTTSGRNITIAAATYVRAISENVKYTAVNLKPFTKNVEFDVASGTHEIRVYRTTRSDELWNDANDNRTHLTSAYVVAATGFADNKPINAPKPLAMTAIRVRASQQLSGTVDGFNGTCISICKDWNGTSWVDRPTRNPASLFRYVLQHPANAQAISDSLIDLTSLASWHDYCRTNEFMCDLLVVDQRSILEVLRDVAACGRASPALRDGKWTVIVDKTNSTVSQFFTPANSWGFEGARAYPKLPHAFRVQFNNSERGYQADEMIVYNDGYTSANATLFEALTLPGVTTKKAIYKHARFHLAQLKLRPETYTLNADIEHLICQRGDRVKVTHDVPMWGIASGRIKEFVSATQLKLTEAIPMDASTQYTIRIRLEDGTDVTRTIASKPQSGLYSDITLTASLTSTQGKAGNLFMAGTLNAESVDCLVLAVEPQENMTARLTLVDYAPSVYDSDNEAIPNFDSQITKPPSLSQSVITSTVTVQSIKSDETVMEVLSNGQYGYRIRVTYSVPNSGVPQSVQNVEGQIIKTSSLSSGVWLDGGSSRIGQPIYFSDVEQGIYYTMRLRLVASDGRTGPWVTTSSHQVVGRTNKPNAVADLITTVDGSKVFIGWTKNPEIDVLGYEVRTSDTSWGGSGYLARTDTTQIEVAPASAGTSRTWYVRAYDSAGLYSATSASVSLTVSSPGTVPVPTQSINKIAASTIVLGVDWADSTAGTLPIAGYEIRSANSSWGSAGYLYKGATSAATLNGVSATSATTFYIKAYDARGNYSTTARSFIHDVTPPASMATATVSVTRKASNLNLVVSNPPATPNDFDAYEFRIGQVRVGATSGDDTPDAVVSGSTDNFWTDPDCKIIRSATTSTTVDLRTFDSPRFSTTGITYRVACRMRDKSGNYSSASALGSINVTSIT